MGSVFGPIIVQNYIWSKESQPIVFSDNAAILNITELGIYTVTNTFRVFNPTSSKIIIELPYANVPREIFYGEPIDISKPQTKSTEINKKNNLSDVNLNNNQYSSVEIDSQKTISFSMSMNINASKEAEYHLEYCVKTIDDKTWCDKGKYVILKSKFNQ